MSFALGQILSLVGRLDDQPGDDQPRERFRRFLRDNVKETGQLRDYIEECLRSSGEQYNRALQDLVNYLGVFLGFEITFGRYQGVTNQIGFDGLWRSPKNYFLVAEVKTSELYPIKTSRLLNYIDELISEKQIPEKAKRLGLYIVGRTDPDIRQLENAIIAEGRGEQLRVVSVDSLLSLAEMMNEYDVSHEDILAVLWPSGPKVDNIVSLITRLVAQERGSQAQENAEAQEHGIEENPPVDEPSEAATYWLTSVRADEKRSVEEIVQSLVGHDKVYGFGDKTPGRKRLKPGDWICFYAGPKGVIAHARVASLPEKKRHPAITYPDKFPWVFELSDSQLYLDNPVLIDPALRSQLNAFRDRDPNGPWAWFVQATHKLDQHDFELLTRRN